MASPDPLLLFFCLLVVLLFPFLTTPISTSNDAVIVLQGTHSTLQSPNRTFELAFFNPRNDAASPPTLFLGIRFASIPAPTYVWVANRAAPFTDSNPTLLLVNGKLVLKLDTGNLTIWETSNEEMAAKVAILETGNLVLVSSNGSTVWQSFDYPCDTWLPGMKLSSRKFLTSWKSDIDPSPGLYSLRLDPLRFNQFRLVYNGTVPYWSTGNWTGESFSGVPEMTIPYIYRFHFENPFSETASFWYTETALDSGTKPPLTKFTVDVNGVFKQFTWAQQTESWDMFWFRPGDFCSVYGYCGVFGVCNRSDVSNPCSCLPGFSAISEENCTRGCGRVGGGSCGGGDGFLKVFGVDRFDGVETVAFWRKSRRECERSCLGNCSCVGYGYDGGSGLCKNFYGSFLNLRDLGVGEDGNVLYVRVGKEGHSDKAVFGSGVLVGVIAGLLFVVLVFGILVGLAIVRRKTGKGVRRDGGGAFPVLTLKVFGYKELYAATKGFSDKVGHGGFGTVFLGELSDSTPVAVKRLDRPGSGEKEFRAEVRTIGNIQHVNLVRLRGFCSQNSHRLLVYDYMPNGPLSAYLHKDGPNLSWDVRFRVAIGTARGIAYLHEECRDCIIHCDIKPENILLDSDYMAKVSDFGLAKLIGRDFSRVLATMRGTWGYVAPEWISGVAITTKADVYSYGMTVLELLGGRRNVEAPPSAGGGMEVEKGEQWFFPPYAAQQIIEGNIAAVIDNRLGSTYDIEEAKRLALVAIWCIQDEEEVRPSMGMVVKMLEGVVEVTTPSQPKLLQALVSGESYRGVQIDSGDGLSTPGRCSGDIVGVSNSKSGSSPSNNSSPVNQMRHGDI